MTLSSRELNKMLCDVAGFLVEPETRETVRRIREMIGPDPATKAVIADLKSTVERQGVELEHLKEEVKKLDHYTKVRC